MKKLLSKWLMGDVVVKKYTSAPYDKVIDTLSKVIKQNDFGIVSVHDMKETYKKKHLQIDKDFEYRIIQICNAPKSHNALKNLSFDMGVMMPKSIIVTRENGQTGLRYMKMKAWMVSLMFPDLDILPISKAVSKTMENIVNQTMEEVMEN